MVKMDDKSKVGLYTLGAFAVGFGASTAKDALTEGQMVIGALLAVVGIILVFSFRGFMDKLK